MTTQAQVYRAQAEELIAYARILSGMCEDEAIDFDRVERVARGLREAASDLLGEATFEDGNRPDRYAVFYRVGDHWQDSLQRFFTLTEARKYAETGETMLIIRERDRLFTVLGGTTNG